MSTNSERIVPLAGVPLGMSCKVVPRHDATLINVSLLYLVVILFSMSFLAWKENSASMWLTEESLTERGK